MTKGINMKEFSIKDKIIVVAGGAGLLGKEFVEFIVENGGVAVVADIKNEYTIDGADFIELNITSRESIDDLIEKTSKKYGKIDAFINSAYPRNKQYGAKFENVAYSDFCENVNLHLGGYFLASQRFSLFFKKQGYGNIINLASIYGVVPPIFELYEGTKMSLPIEYAAIKSAIIHITKYMAAYFKGSNIRFNCISPGGILDGQPEKFLAKYDSNCLSKGMLDRSDLNGTVLYLLSDASKYVNGQNIIVDDGFIL